MFWDIIIGIAFGTVALSLWEKLATISSDTSMIRKILEDEHSQHYNDLFQVNKKL